MNIKGIGFANYKSFGQPVFISPITKLNIFIGRNNAGKSNVLSYIKDVLPVIKIKEKLNDSLNSNRHLGESPPHFELFVEVEIDEYIKSSFPGADINLIKFINEILLDARTIEFSGKKYFKYILVDGAFIVDPETFDRAKKLSISSNIWNQNWMRLTNSNGGNIDSHWIPQLINRIDPLISGYVTFPSKVHLIPAIRRIGKPDSEFNGFAGDGLIKLIAELQNPSLHEQEKKKDFNSIVKFLQTVTKNETAQIEIPFHRNMILVHMDGKTLPLEALGTGIHQVIILAAAATSLKDAFVCLEEPEIHLHPRLQRELMKYLRTETTNTYFITTHSVTIIDSPGSSIFHVSNDGKSTRISSINDDMIKSKACSDVGAKASDIAQANSIVWVEGPSDKIYIEHLLGIAAPDLIEGIDFSIMFYGGRLLSHVTIDEDLDGFVRLLKINRNSAVVIDSDKKSKTSTINITKARIKTEVAKISGYCWVTSVREIENCLPVNVFQNSIKTIYGGSCVFGALDDFSDWLSIKKGSKDLEVNKVKLAREVIKSWTSLEQGKVKKEIMDLAEFIRKCSE